MLASYSNNISAMGSGCGSVGSAVASNIRDQQFESSHQQILFWTFAYCQLYWADENKGKRDREQHI